MNVKLFCGKNSGTFGKEIVPCSFDDYRRSILEKRFIPFDVRGEARAKPLKRMTSPKTDGPTVDGSAIHGEKGMEKSLSRGPTAMVGYGRHGKQCDGMILYPTSSIWLPAE